MTAFSTSCTTVREFHRRWQTHSTNPAPKAVRSEWPRWETFSLEDRKLCIHGSSNVYDSAAAASPCPQPGNCGGTSHHEQLSTSVQGRSDKDEQSTHGQASRSVRTPTRTVLQILCARKSPTRRRLLDGRTRARVLRHQRSALPGLSTHPACKKPDSAHQYNKKRFSRADQPEVQVHVRRFQIQTRVSGIVDARWRRRDDRVCGNAAFPGKKPQVVAAVGAAAAEGPAFTPAVNDLPAS